MVEFIKKFKIVFILSAVVLAVAVFIVAAYLWFVPSLVASENVQNFFAKQIYEKAGVNVKVKNFKLDTKHVPYISFSADDFELSKNGKYIVVLNNIDGKISLSRIKFQNVIIKHLNAKYIFVDVNKLLDILPKSDKKKEPSAWSVDVIGAVLNIDRLKVLYKSNGVNFDIDTKNININSKDKNKIPVKFDFTGLVTQGNYKVKLAMRDNNKIYIKKKHLYIDASTLTVNDSKVRIKGSVKDNKHYDVTLFARGFNLENIISLIRSNTIIKNGSTLLSYFGNIHGNFDFAINIVPKGIEGRLDLHKLAFLFIPMEKVPINLHNGVALIGKKNIHLQGFSGYYGSRKVNSIKFTGDVKDYRKDLKLNIIADGVVTNDFAKYYLTPIIGVPLSIIGKANTRLIIKSKKNVYDFKWLFRISEKDDLLVDGAPITPFKEERVLVSDMSVYSHYLKIKNMNYYVTVPGVAAFFRRKLISLNGLIDFKNGVDFRAMGFEIEQPVPSAFLNIITRKNLLKDGTVVGKMIAVDGKKGVKLFGNLSLNKVRVPSQRLYIDYAKITTNFNKIYIDSKGGYRHSHYQLNGDMFNNIAFPIIVNNIDFTLDSMDIKKMVESFNQQDNGETKSATAKGVSDDAPTFDITNLIIKNGNFNLNKGTYGELSVANVKANMTLDKTGDLELNSNKFDFAEGTTSCHVCCDLKKHKYHTKLGIRDVNFDLIATALLNLPEEIIGKADGLIDINTDSSMKLNGNIKFRIKDGTIGKIGLIEYVLNVASVFRNPLAMVSPLTIFDLMNVPDGKFDLIAGTLDLNDNVIENIKIKSFAPNLCSYIAGSYDMKKNDASMRIYTKMSGKSTGIYGFLRELSLSNIASRVSIGARNDVVYYSSEISEIPKLKDNDENAQVFLTRVDGDVASNNFLSSLKKLK